MRKSIIALAALAATSTSAFAADYAEPAPEAFSWTGFYAGVFAAYNDVQRDLELADVDTTLEFDDSLSGFSGGGLIGFNYQFDSIVVGIEGDIAFASLDDSEAIASDGVSTVSVEDEIDTTYGVRARLGYALDHTLLFVTGGAAWADYESTLDQQGADPESAEIFDETLFGWQIGAGVEQAVTDNVTVRLDYLFTDYESIDDEVDGTDIEADLDSHIIRLGVNFLLNTF